MYKGFYLKRWQKVLHCGWVIWLLFYYYYSYYIVWMIYPRCVTVASLILLEFSGSVIICIIRDCSASTISFFLVVKIDYLNLWNVWFLYVYFRPRGVNCLASLRWFLTRRHHGFTAENRNYVISQIRKYALLSLTNNPMRYFERRETVPPSLKITPLLRDIFPPRDENAPQSCTLYASDFTTHPWFTIL